MNEQKLLAIQKSISEMKDYQKKGYSLSRQNEQIIKDILADTLPTINGAISLLTEKKDGEMANLSDINSIVQASEMIYNYSSKIKNELELDIFFSQGKNFDIEKLKKIYKTKKLKKKFPKFNLDRFLEVLRKPILEIENFRGEKIKYNPFWVRKNLIAIVQMVFNEMDLYILNIGKEGSGKSCWSSQQMLYFFTFLTETGLIDYEYNIKRMFFADILSFLNEHDNQKNSDYFRIECLDEGNDLNRSNFRDETNRQFKYEMRTDRRMLRIIMINMQQIGELDTSISLSRVNFIYDCKMRNNTRTGTLAKGFVDMYIVPRGDVIYSPVHKKNLTRTQILNAFATKLDKKKDYYVSLPKEILIKQFKFKDIWGFDKGKYDKHIKDEMRKHKFGKNIKLTEYQAYILIKKFSNLKQVGTFDLEEAADKKMYHTIRKWFKGIESYFDLHPDKKEMFGKYYAKSE